MFTLWPQEVRADLRAGIKARNNGDYVMSEKFLRRCVFVTSVLIETLILTCSYVTHDM